MSAKLSMAVSMLIFGTISIFARYINLASSGLAFYRAFIAVMGLCIYKLIKRERWFAGITKKTALLLLLSGAAIGFNWVMLFEAYNYTSVATATLCYYFAPVIVIALCPIIFKEKVTIWQAICFIMSTAGLVLITLVGKQTDYDIRGILFGLGAALLYALVMMLNKSIQGITGIDRTLIQFICACAVLLPYAFFTNGLSLKNVGFTGIGALLILGIVYTCITYVLYLNSISKLEGRVTALLGYIDPLCAVAVSVCVFNERLLPLSALGGIMILGFTLLSDIKKIK